LGGRGGGAGWQATPSLEEHKKNKTKLKAIINVIIMEKIEANTSDRYPIVISTL